MPRAPDRPGRSALPALIAALASSAACASTAHPFDVRFEGGDYPAAARAFAADSTLHLEPRALWRSAVIHSTPAADTYNLARARARLERLLSRAPESEYAAPAAALLGVLEEMERREERTRKSIAALRARIDAAEAEHAAWLAALERALPGTEAYDLAGAREDLSAFLDRYPESRERAAAEAVIGLLDEVARNRAAVGALRRQLDQLKAVDLEDPPY